MVQAMAACGLKAALSNSAGTFVCNHLLYGVLHTAQEEMPACRAGFLHVPYLPQQVRDKPGMAAMALQDIVCGLQAALEVIAG